MSLSTTPVRLNLKRDEKLEIEWQDGHKSAYTLAYLRQRCPCAACRTERQEQSQKKSLLRVLPASAASDRPLVVVTAEKVGNYAIRLEWSDDHSTGIYSYEYLREICPEDRTP